MQIVLDLKAGITVGNDGNLTVEVNGELVKVDYSKLLKSRRNRDSSKSKSKKEKSEGNRKQLDLIEEDKIVGNRKERTEIVRKLEKTTKEQLELDRKSEKEKAELLEKEGKGKITIDQIMTKEELEIYRILSDEPVHINELAKKLGKPVFEVSPAITMMEINGYVEQPQTNYFRRNI